MMQTLQFLSFQDYVIFIRQMQKTVKILVYFAILFQFLNYKGIKVFIVTFHKILDNQE